jgi:hypothetical protein
MLTTKTRMIWQGLTAYANAARVDEARLRETILSCLPVTAYQTWGFVDRVLNNPHEFPLEAQKYREPIKDLLMDLVFGDVKSERFKFLIEHCKHVTLTLDEVPVADSADEQFYSLAGGLKPSPLGIWARSMDGKDIVDPLCDFILRECERVRESGERLPIFRCSNPACENLFVPMRVKLTAANRFCGTDCKDAFNNRENSRERTSEQFLRRLAAKPPSSIRRKFGDKLFEKRYEEHKTKARGRSAIHIRKIEAGRAHRARVVDS